MRDVKWRKLGEDLLLTAKRGVRALELVLPAKVGCKLAHGIKLDIQLLMFTGIVEETGTVERIKPTGKSIGLTVRANVGGRGLKIGASVAVNGCCLTAVKISPRGKIKVDPV